MSSELERAYAALSRDAERARLAPAAELRRRAGRRAAVRSAAALVAVAVLATGATVGTRFALAGDGRRPPQQPADIPVSSVPAPVSSTTPVSSTAPVPPASSAPPSSATPAMPKSVPARALLNAGDGNTGEFSRLETARRAPELCSKAAYPSEDLAGVRASVSLLYRSPELSEDYTPQDEVYDTVTVYRDGGAGQFLDDLRDAVRACPEGKLGDLPATYRSLGSMDLGDESLLIERSTEGYNDDGTPSGDRRRTYLAAVRVGDAVTLLETYGYESVPSERPVVESLTRTATNRLAAWR